MFFNQVLKLKLFLFSKHIRYTLSFKSIILKNVKIKKIFDKILN